MYVQAAQKKLQAAISFMYFVRSNLALVYLLNQKPVSKLSEISLPPKFLKGSLCAPAFPQPPTLDIIWSDRSIENHLFLIRLTP